MSPNQIFTCAAILFDLDGVLVDSTRSVTRQWTQWAIDNKVEPQKLLEIAHGRRTVEVIRLMAPHLAAEDEATRLEKREAEDTDGVDVMPGAAALLNSLPANRWCVVTSGTRALATARLVLANLPFPAVLVSADEVVNGKPDPEPYLKGAEMLAVRAESCLVIEDAPAGIRSAHAGGMRVIGITSTFAAEELGEADAVISALSQLQISTDDTGKIQVAIHDRHP